MSTHDEIRDLLARYPFEPDPDDAAEIAAEVLGAYGFTADDIREGLADGGSITVTGFTDVYANCSWPRHHNRSWPHLLNRRGDRKFFWPHQVGPEEVAAGLARHPLLAASALEGWGQHFFTNDLGGARRTWDGGAGACSQNHFTDDEAEGPR